MGRRAHHTAGCSDTKKKAADLRQRPSSLRSLRAALCQPLTLMSQGMTIARPSPSKCEWQSFCALSQFLVQAFTISGFQAMK
jgi:hypothetical protein